MIASKNYSIYIIIVLKVMYIFVLLIHTKLFFMKKILLSVMMAVLAMNVVSATETTIDCTKLTWAGVAEKAKVIVGKSDGFTITIDQAKGITAPTQNGTAKDVRAYADNTITIESANGTITSAVFTMSKNALKRWVSSPANVGTVAYDVANLTSTWTGSASSFIMTVGKLSDMGTEAGKAGQFCFDAITFTTGTATSVSAPAFSPAGGTFYATQNVTLKCSTADAVIYYTVDGTTPTTASAVYSTPISVSKIGDTTIKAFAVKAGLDNSSVSSATYTIATVPTVANIAAFIAGPTDSPVQITNPVYVVYQNGPNLYIKDETGSLLVYGTITSTYNNGDKIAAGITGKMELYNGIPEMTNLVDNSFAAGEAGATITPESKGVGQIGIDMVNQYVIIYDVTIAATEVAKNYTLSDGEDLIAAYAKFADVVFPTDANKYDVTGLVTIFKNAVQIYPTAIVKNTGVSNVETATTSIVAANGAININTEVAAEAIVINGAGQVVAQKAVVAGANSIEVATGFYIVKVANKVAKVIVK